MTRRGAGQARPPSLVRVSMDVALDDLATTLDRYTFAYLTTVGTGTRAHIVAVRPVLDGVVLRITQPGGKTGRNVGEQPAVSLVWPPSDPDGYSLIVDGTGVLDGDELGVTPTRAVLHRPAPSATPNPDTGCQSDCVELPLPAGTR